VKSFSEQMRSAIRGGVAPATAMREAWALVKRGQVAPPPRRSSLSRAVGPKRRRQIVALARRGTRRNAFPSAYAIPNASGYTHGGTSAALQRLREREEAERRAKAGSAGQWWEYMGYACQALGASYNCPALKLYGYATPGHLERAVKRAVAKRSKPKPNAPNAYRAGELAARVFIQSGGRTAEQLEKIADAHAAVYGLPKGDVYEFARKFAANTLRLRHPDYRERPNPRQRFVCPSCTRGSHGLCIAGSGCQCSAPVHERLRREAATVAQREASEYAEHLRGLGRRRPRRNPYYAELEAASGTLLGGVTKTQSWPFARRQDAETFLVQSGRANLDAGRKLGRTRVIYRRRDPLRRKPITAAELGNPPAVLIYDKVLKIFARKGRGPHKGQRFVHRFSSSPRMLGLPNGDLLITGR
jgi:hypothetical protein